MANEIFLNFSKVKFASLFANGFYAIVAQPARLDILRFALELRPFKIFCSLTMEKDAENKLKE